MMNWDLDSRHNTVFSNFDLILPSLRSSFEVTKESAYTLFTFSVTVVYKYLKHKRVLLRRYVA
jgi:hypothetical protein